ncbi:ribosomal-protein-alanine N-acetyltransferase [Paenibacillus forsythiae]|uniref:Ribosomal-protein-alanine N-acetyltransferase n=1 Tax=Paenibacillus forsythiae TaxID=365616 RepID=A0ABU3H946_9BACL|nr:GNAT family N-acetyltransferase [Paenibacillus forsythiae]MDT3426976.1 ribosomal-protein-alanine N-acetyltransferase [Paenibacillus forsythiae]
MHAGTQIIETERLMLRPFDVRDAGSMHRNWISDQEVQSNYGEPAYEDVGSVKDLLLKWISSYSRSEFYRWAIILKDGGECIGQIAFCHVDEQHHCADMEYCIGKSYQNKGYASEALGSVIGFTFRHTGLNRLQAFHRGRNVSSARVLQKAGMKYEGTLRQSYYYSDTDEYDDRVYYGITRSDIGWTI